MEKQGEAEMQPGYNWLEKQVLLAFKLALADNRLDVADHLLWALKSLKSDGVPGLPLADADLSVSHPRRTLVGHPARVPGRNPSQPAENHSEFTVVR
jgi:hypothetical protein